MELCGEHVITVIAGASWISCALDKGHEGGHRGKGNCFRHGEYFGDVGVFPLCPQWPTCIQNITADDEWIKKMAVLEDGCFVGAGSPSVGNPLIQIPNCPKCGNPLEKVRQSSNSPLNEEQFDSVRAGDWFCKCHSNERGNKPWAYFWDSEVLQSETSSPVPETEFTPLKDRQSALIERLFARKGTSEHQGQPHAGLQYVLDECIDLEEKLLESIRTIYQLRSQLRNWETWGTVEIAVRNPNVDSYMKHWEGRALAAEEKVVELEGRIANALL
jgi:hypothetical protein